MVRDSVLRNLPLPGHAVGPGGLSDPKQLGDMNGLEVEMTSEQVDLSLLLIDGQLHMDVDVTFTFKNHAAQDTKLEVCYPIGLKNNVVSFECETDGLVHDPKLLSRDERYSRITLKVWFYEWEADFPAGQFVMHKVKYRLNLAGARRSGYTVSSGGPWKGRIAKSVVTLSGTPEAWDRVRKFGPLAEASESKDRIVWRYADYDPAPKHDIWIDYQNTTFDATCKASWGDGSIWDARCRVVALRSQAFYAGGRLHLTQDDQRALRTALVDLIAEATEAGECVVMPATEKRMIVPAPE